MKNLLKNISYKHYFAVLLVVISLIASQAIHSVVTKAAAPETKITSIDGASNDQFGINVFIYNDYAVIGATGDDDGTDNSGSAYVFKKSVDTWSQIAKLTASDGLLNDAFGESISVNDDFIFIGSNRHTASVANEGTVYVFKKPVSEWSDMTETAKLTASDMQSGDGFGRSISSSNSTVVIGAYTDNEPTDDEGSAYVFERSVDTWNQIAKLTASGGAVDDQFGNSVSISGDNIAIGAPGYSGSSSGSAYVFVKPGTGWATTSTFDAKLTASDGVTDDFFGRSISISGDNIIIGAHGDDDSGSSSGSAYVFVKPGTGWVTTNAETAKLTASDGISSTYFGYSVSILDSHVAIGSPGDNFPNQSSIYLFEQPGGGWSDMTETRKIIASDIANGDSTGYSINQFGDYIIVGAHGDDNIGSAYIHDRTNIHYAFTDTNFQQCVDIAVDGIDDDIIDVALAAALTGALNCNSYGLGILNISGAQYLTSITDLWLTDNSISDLTPVSTLSSLTDLHLAENNISDLSPLSGMTNLKNLALDSNNFADSELTILNNLTNLVSLSLYGNNIASLNGGVNWAGLTSLTTLNLNSNNLESKDLDSIKGLTTLRSLHLNHNNITTLTDLSGLVNLTNLALNNNDISDLAAIGSGNATLTGFRDNNVINISSNNFTGVESAALTEIHDYLEGTPNPATVIHNINWENCSDGIDNDDDGDIDGADTYCFTTFYVDYDSGVGTACTEASPCASISAVFGSNPDFGTLVTTTPVEDVNIYVRGAINSQDSASAYITPITSNITIQSWGSTPILNGGGISITGQNITLEGFEIKNAPSFGVMVTGDGSTIRNSHIHDNGIGIYMGTRKGVGGNNISVYNNVLINNENAAANVCGGVLTAGTTNNIIINNTLYNNCSTFAFNGTTTFMAGDIVLAAVPGMGLPAPSDVLVKQNIVYNDLGTGNTYYYGDGISVNGSTVFGGPLTDQTAADFGTGNNFSEKVTIPFFYDATYSAQFKIDCSEKLAFKRNPFSIVQLFFPTAYAIGGVMCMNIEAAFALSSAEIANYQIGTPDAETPTTDFSGNTRPSGTLEAGAIETPSASGGGDEPEVTSEGTVIECTPLPTQLDIRDAIVTQLDGNPAVTLKWGQAGLRDINPNQKIEIFFDYLALYPPAVIGSNNIRLQNVFTSHIYNEVSGTLKEVIDNKLEGIYADVCDNEISENILKIVKEMISNSEMSSLIVSFADDLLSLESTIIESSDSINSYFTDYYYGLFKSNGSSAGSVKVIRKVNIRGNYITDKTTEISSDATSWTDTTIPITNVSKTYKYQIITENCGEIKNGNEVEVVIDPVIPKGTNVDVTLNLKIKIKDAYDNLIMEKFRKLFIESYEEEIYENIRTCEEVKDEFFEAIDSESALECLIACYGQKDYRLINEIVSKQKQIIPPLIKMLRLGLSEDYIKAKTLEMINGIKEEIEFNATFQTFIKDEQLQVGDFVNKLNIDELDTSEMEIMKLISKDYFEGVSHSSNITIEKYDADNNLLETYNANTDIFGNVTVGIGEFVSGDDYTLKIKLGDERFVLPKVATMQINNAVKKVGTFGTIYTSNVDLEFDRSFRYGDFNEDEEINLSDVNSWGMLLSGNTAINGYELWEIWQFANLDGLEGIDLLDVVTLQENWGGLKEFRVEDSEVKLTELLGLFGITITSDPKLDVMVKVAGWLDLVGVEC